MRGQRMFTKIVLVLLIFALSPGFVAGSIEEAKKALANGNEPAARKILTGLLKADGDRGARADAVLLLASIEHSLAARLALLEQFASRYRTHAGWPEALSDLAWLYTVQERYAEAALVLARILAVPAWRETALLSLARIAVMQEHWSQVDKYCDILEKEYPEGRSRAGVLACRAHVLQALGKPQEASLAWHAITEKFAQSSEAPAAWFALGEMAAASRDTHLARDYFSKLVTGFPSSLEAGLARSKLRLIASDAPGTRELRVWEVQLAVFFRQEQAESFVDTLKKAGYRSFVMSETVAGRVQYSVRMGYFRSKQDAQQVHAEMLRNGYEGFIRTRTVTVTEDELGRH